MAISEYQKQYFPIIGIGASAGGLEALQRFLGALSPDFNFSLIFIQHLSSRHKSMLHELLAAKLPSLPIQETSDGLKALPGRLYLVPPGRELRLKGGFFETTVHQEGLMHFPIDEFLVSLAEDAGERAVAVIFSGAGTDGARGCQAVRAAGGTVYVQDPETAGFDSMPLAAIATGTADAVLAPEDICREILKIEATGAAAADNVESLTPDEHDLLFRLLLEKTGSRFHHYKKSVVSRRIRRRMYLHGLSSLKEYIDLVSSRDNEAAALASDLLIGVTSFFRDRIAWRALNTEVIRKIALENSDYPVRIWTPASATGEEAYSLTMMLSHELSLAGKKREIQVFATDVNDRALERAREGKYPASIAEDVPREYVQKYFTSSDDGHTLTVTKEIRECVIVAKQDILTDPPFSRLDLVICRNFLIYLEPDAQEKCISLFHYALKDGGALFLGNAETVGRRSALFKSIGRKQCRIYRKVASPTETRLSVSVPYASERTGSLAPVRPALTERQIATGFVQEFLLEEFAPTAIAIDQNYDIVYHNGPTNRFLRQPRGIPTQNLLELLPEMLRNRIRGAIYRSGQEGKPVSIRVNMPDDNNRKRMVTLRLSKVKENLFVIVFREKTGPAGREEFLPIEAERVEQTAIQQLETELSATRQDLQSNIEKLKSLNEELQSSNEELQAANEELETSREELQSVNEELVTVNSQLQAKIEEQDETNNDLNNFLASTNIPTMFLDPQFKLKRFTPAMLRLIKLLPSDVGRPIVDLSQENLGPELIADAQTVLEGLVPIKKEISISSTHYVRTTLPYRTGDSRIAGVVITYNDVTELKTAEERTRHLASFPQFNPNPVLEINPSGAIVFSNRATQNVLESLGIDRNEARLFLPHDIDSILQDLKRNIERTLTREVVVGESVFEDTIYVSPKFSAVRIYAFDVTDRKRAEAVTGRLAALVESAEDAIISKDLNGVIETWNIGAEKIFGYTAREAVGRNISFLMPPGHVDETPEIIKRIARGEHIDHFESVRMRKNGAVVPVSLTYSPIRDAGGGVTGISKIVHDITERRQAEEAVKESEAKYRNLFENMVEEVHFWQLVRDENGRIKTWRLVDANPPTMKTWGRSTVDEIRGKTTDEIFGPGATEHYLPIIQKIMTEGKPYSYEDYFPNLDRYFRFTSVPLGEYFFTTGADITSIKKAEEAIRESEKQFRTLADSIPNLAWWANSDGYITWYNRRWYEYTGMTPEQTEGWGWQSVHHAEVLPKVLERWKASIETGNPFDMEFPLRGADGIFRPFLTRVLPLKDSAGKVLRWFGTNTDVSERKQSEEALLRLNKALKALSDSSQAVIRSEDEQQYLNDVCRIIVEDCGYSMTWIGYAEQNDSKSIRPVAYSGFERGYLETLKLSWADTERGRGPTGTAIRTGKVAICRNMQTDPAFAPWREEAMKRGYASSIVFPLRSGAQVFGAITIYSKAADPFTDQEIRLMAELSDNAAYGIGVLRIRASQKQAEEALRESEARVRRKLDTVLSPEGDIGSLDLSDIINAESIQVLMDDFYNLARMPMSIIDLKGKMLVGVGWQRVCTEFHRANPETCRNCTESDLELSAHVPEGEFKLYKCKNNMWDVATPIFVGGKHMGNLFMGQFFFEDEAPDYAFFREQARRYGFNEEKYIAALDAVPRLSRDALKTSMGFFLKFADMVSKLSYSNVKLARSLAERDGLMDSLRTSEERFSLAFANNPAAIALTRLDDGLFLDVNDTWMSLNGYLREEVLGLSARKLPIWPTADAGARFVRELRDKGTVRGWEQEFRKKSGELFVAALSAQVLTIRGEKVILSTMVDITDRKHAEAELLKLSEDMAARNHELELLNKELEAFAYSVSHDLRAPLRSMSGFSKIMTEDYAEKLDATGKDYLSRIQNASEKMTRLIDDLLRLSQISRQSLDRIEVDLSKLSESVAAGIREANPGRNVEVVIHPGIKTSADPSLMRVALTNLMDNAWKFSSGAEKARIEFGTLEREEQGLKRKTTVYFVRDNGAGFDQQFSERMFLPFHRLHSDKEFAGTGIGLAIVERIIRRHGGRIWAEGKIGKGATIFFTLG